LSFTDVQKKLLVSPYLGIGGVAFLVATGIVIHTAINSIYSDLQIGFVENLIGLISLFIGIASIIVIMILIAIIFEKKRQEIIITIILLSIFIALEFFRSLSTSIENMSIWGNIAFVIAYGVLRGIAFQRTNNALKVPHPKYETKAFGAYGWSYISIGSLSIILAIIGVVIFSPGLILFAYWLQTILYIVQGICYLVIGIRFIQYAFTTPEIKGFVVKPVGRSTITGTSTPIIAEQQYLPQQEIKSEETISEEFETTVNYCGNCGSEIFGERKICQTCGEAKE